MHGALTEYLGASQQLERDGVTGAVALQVRHWGTIILLCWAVVANMWLTGGLINHAGRQRMLIQELGYQISEMITLRDPELAEMIRRIRDTADQLERVHLWLINGDAE